jgi:tRNA 5-methylaminomethyl-2-thiouridine biosynthesis bifunctional protein
VLQDKQLSLTLCVGAKADNPTQNPTESLLKTLAELRIQADTIWAPHPAQLWDRWGLKALSKLCRSGTQVYLPWQHNAQGQVQIQLHDLEFVGLHPIPSIPSTPNNANIPIPPNETSTQATSACAAWQHICEFRPPWKTGTRRVNTPHAPAALQHCAVIGAGLSGASVAYALAQRGLQVTVLDQHPQAAQADHGLPVGIFSPHTSADDSPLSRLSRSGIRLLQGHAHALLQHGQDWADCGVQEQRPGEPPRWHGNAGWLKPAQLVRAWLNHPRITVVAPAHIDHLRPEGKQWHLCSAQGETYACADAVVLANAHGCQALLARLLHAHPQALAHANLEKIRAIEQVWGTISHGLHPIHTVHPSAVTLPRHPVNGHGSFIPAVPSPQGLQWFMGASYEKTATTATATATATLAPPIQHTANFSKLSQLLPEVARQLHNAFTSPTLRAWQGARCVAHDRLPLVGALQTETACSLWLCAAMGSRGLALAALCAEQLMAQMFQEPWPLPASLARSLDVQRTQRGPKNPSAA